MHSDVERASEDANLGPPTIDQLEEWMWEGGCQAACVHECWVEPDGYCPHGKPSWLLVMGLI